MLKYKYFILSFNNKIERKNKIILLNSKKNI